MKISSLGDSALTLDFADESSDRARLLARTLSAAERLEGANLPGVMDVTCGYESVAVFFDPARIERDFEDKIGALVSSAGIRALRKARKIEIPVCYDDEFALDLARVASQTFLTGDAVIALHSSIEYTVACIGFVPGFPFLAGLPDKLCVPRLESPPTKVPAGSVAIANAQAGIYSFESPGGWNVIGRTPLRLFRATETPPLSCDPGIVCVSVESPAHNLMPNKNDCVRYFGRVPDYGAGLRPRRTPQVWRDTWWCTRFRIFASRQSSGWQSGLHGWFGVFERPGTIEG